MPPTRRSEQAISETVLAEADAYAKVRAEALRRGLNSTNQARRDAFLEIAEFCDQQERTRLNEGRTTGVSSNSGHRIRRSER